MVDDQELYDYLVNEAWRRGILPGQEKKGRQVMFGIEPTGMWTVWAAIATALVIAIVTVVHDSKQEAWRKRVQREAQEEARRISRGEK